MHGWKLISPHLHRSVSTLTLESNLGEPDVAIYTDGVEATELVQSVTELQQVLVVHGNLETNTIPGTNERVERGC